MSDLISQYGGAKVKQTEKMYDEYANLWKKVTELEKESEQFDSVDSKLQVWNEVDDIINNNISPLLEVTSKDDVIALWMIFQTVRLRLTNRLLQMI